MAAVSPPSDAPPFSKTVNLPGVSRPGVSAEATAGLLQLSARRLDAALSVSPRSEHESFEVVGPQPTVERFASGLEALWASHLNAAASVREDVALNISVNLSEPVVDVWAVVVLYNPVATEVDQRKSTHVRCFWTRFEEAGGDVALWSNHVAFLHVVPLLGVPKPEGSTEDEKNRRDLLVAASQDSIFTEYTAKRIEHYAGQASSGRPTEKFSVILCAGSWRWKGPSVEALKVAVAELHTSVELYDGFHVPKADSNGSQKMTPVLERLLKGNVGVAVRCLQNVCGLSDAHISAAFEHSGENGPHDLKRFVSGRCENYEKKRALFWKYYFENMRRHFHVPADSRCQPYEEASPTNEALDDTRERLWELKLDKVTDVRPANGWRTFFNLDDQRLPRPCPICCLTTSNHTTLVHHIVGVHAPASASQMHDDALALATVNTVWMGRRPGAPSAAADVPDVVISPSSAVWRLRDQVLNEAADTFEAWTDGQTAIPAVHTGRGGSATVYQLPDTSYCLRVDRGATRQASLDTVTGPASHCLLLSALFSSLPDDEADALEKCCALPLLGCWALLEGATVWVELMRFVQGDTLMETIESAACSPQEIFFAIQEAVRVLHDTAKLAHGDLKPQNIMLTPKDEGFDVTLIDFTTLSDPNTVPSMSTPGYYESESQTAIERDKYALEVIRMQLLVASLVKDKQSGVDEPEALKQFQLADQQRKRIRAAYEALEEPSSLETADALLTLMDRNPLRSDEDTPLSWDACVEIGLASALPPPDAFGSTKSTASANQAAFNQVATQAAELMRRCDPIASDLLTLHTCYALLNHDQFSPYTASASFASHGTATKASQLSQCSQDTIRSFFFAAAAGHDRSALEGAAALAEHCIRYFDGAGGDITIGRLLQWLGHVKPSDRKALEVMHVVLTPTEVTEQQEGPRGNTAVDTTAPDCAAATAVSLSAVGPAKKIIVVYQLPRAELADVEQGSDGSNLPVWRFGTLMSRDAESLQLHDVVPRPCDACFTHPDHSGWSVAHPPTVKAFPTRGRVLRLARGEAGVEDLAKAPDNQLVAVCGQGRGGRYALQHIVHKGSAGDHDMAFLKQLICNGSLRSLRVEQVTYDTMLDIATALAGKPFLAKVSAGIVAAPTTAGAADLTPTTTADVLALKLRCAALTRCCRDIELTVPHAVQSELLTSLDDSGAALSERDAAGVALQKPDQCVAADVAALQRIYHSKLRSAVKVGRPFLIEYATAVIENHGVWMVENRVLADQCLSLVTDVIKEALRIFAETQNFLPVSPVVKELRMITKKPITWVVKVTNMSPAAAVAIIDHLTGMFRDDSIVVKLGGCKKILENSKSIANFLQHCAHHQPLTVTNFKTRFDKVVKRHEKCISSELELLKATVPVNAPGAAQIQPRPDFTFVSVDCHLSFGNGLIWRDPQSMAAYLWTARHCVEGRSKMKQTEKTQTEKTQTEKTQTEGKRDTSTEEIEKRLAKVVVVRVRAGDVRLKFPLLIDPAKVIHDHVGDDLFSMKLDPDLMSWAADLHEGNVDVIESGPRTAVTSWYQELTKHDITVWSAVTAMVKGYRYFSRAVGNSDARIVQCEVLHGWLSAL